MRLLILLKLFDITGGVSKLYHWLKKVVLKFIYISYIT